MKERQLEEGEVLILTVLLSRELDWDRQPVDLRAVRVLDMDDGGMGSLRFTSGTLDPVFGRTVAEGWFMDDDGLPVMLWLNLDQNDDLFELDSWKVDSSPRRRLPRAKSEVLDGDPRAAY